MTTSIRFHIQILESGFPQRNCLHESGNHYSIEFQGKSQEEFQRKGGRVRNGKWDGNGEFLALTELILTLSEFRPAFIL